MKNKNGFTLMEMLIVVAIIAILVSIGIPTLSRQLVKAKQTADNANIRNLYNAVIAEWMLTGKRTCAQGTWKLQTKYDGEFKLDGKSPNPTWPIKGFSKVDTYIWINISANGDLQWGANRFPLGEDGKAGSVVTTFRP